MVSKPVVDCFNNLKNQITCYIVLYKMSSNHILMHANLFYLTFYTFSFEINECRLSDTRCLIQDLASPHCGTVVIKEWRDVARDVLC